MRLLLSNEMDVMKQPTKYIPFAIAACIALAFIVSGELTNFALGFFLTGVIPGTSVVVPAWVMILFYISLMCSVTMIFVGSTANDLKTQSQKSRKARMPRRRYSHI